ncbi:MAG: hypothetical protein JSR18_08320 [Proteobacteria bacterium]|nr:hypothetical protein [Pseudomonadota bacterium]
MTSLLTASACIAVIALNLLATSRVLRNTALTDERRMITLALIWIVPVVTAIIVLLMPAPGAHNGS